jgi:hypothetical protein
LLLSAANKLSAELEPPKDPHRGFEAESGTLASLETSAEASDAAPTAALRQSAVETIAEVNSDWAEWQTRKSTELAQLNRDLAAAGLQPISIPSQSELNARAPESGVDLP